MNISLAHSLTVVWMILKVMANLWASTFAGRSWYGERDVKVLLGGGSGDYELTSKSHGNFTLIDWSH